MGLYELLINDNQIRQLAHDHATTWAIKNAAIQGGMRTLREDGWRKVLHGHTSVDEIIRVTKGDVELLVKR
jgi:general secretion pathway protein E/type IV pilus assembly protein PilB